jgi:hypothetical protein
MVIKTIEDLYFLKHSKIRYRYLKADIQELKYRGVLRHLIVYALNRLEDEGIFEIVDEPHASFSLRKGKIDFVQVKQEVFRVLKNRVEILDADNKTGLIRLKKLPQSQFVQEGFSFGIVFGGNDKDLLKLAVDSILANDFPKGIPFEIVIAGPHTINQQELMQLWEHNAAISYLPLDIQNEPRILICEKKNALFNACRYSKAIISHTRIVFGPHFAKQLNDEVIEIAIPEIRLLESNKKYIDYFLISSYDDMVRKPTGPVIGYLNIDKNYLKYFGGRVPCIDGALNVFNKNLVVSAPYNKHVAWGEAEDFEMCARLHHQGILIDYLPNITCYSQTNKTNIRFEELKKPLRTVYKFWLRNRR